MFNILMSCKNYEPSKIHKTPIKIVNFILFGKTAIKCNLMEICKVYYRENNAKKSHHDESRMQVCGKFVG